MNPGWIALVVGAGLLAAAAGQYGSVRGALARASTAPGRVVAVDAVARAPHSDGSSTDTVEYFPWIEYRDARGATLKFRTRTAHPQTAFHVGDPVTVLYQADDPSSAVIDRATEVWHLPIALALAGACGVAFGCVLLVKHGAPG